MWALRRASKPLKNRAFSLGSCRAGSATLEIASCYSEDDAKVVEQMRVTFVTFVSSKRYHHSRCDSPDPFWRNKFSSQTGMTSSEEEDDDLEDKFSELETPTTADAAQLSSVAHENEDELVSTPELSDEEDNSNGMAGLQNELELSDTETDVSQKRVRTTRTSLQIFQAIMSAPGLSVQSVLDRWVEEGNDVNKTDIFLVMNNLWKRRMFGRALQLSEWVESSKHLDFSERDYACRLDLIAKIQGLQKAERFIETIPKSFRGERVHRTFLANCVFVLNVRKAEGVFKKMKDLGFTVTPFACNQMLLLYRRTNKKKIADILLFMEKENVKPTLFTYNILIDTKGHSKDITGMDQIIETMKAEGIEPSIRTQTILANHYVSCGLKEKAEAVMKEMQKVSLNENRAACQPLILLYASLGKAKEVSRIWKVCESKPDLGQYLAAIVAWGKLKKVEEAEALFEEMLKRWEKPSSKLFSALLEVYANHKMLAKGKDLVNRMAVSGCRIGPLTLDSLVKLYVQAGEVEKADLILQKAIQNSQTKPMFNSFIAIMDQYSKRGDVHNSEKIFQRMRQVGYFSSFRQFLCLMQAYINAKSPAYGMRERMIAANIFPNRLLAEMLAQVDAFKKTAISELLD